MDHDELLERAIASYSAMEPGEGFSGRVLRRAVPKRRRWAWAVVPVLASACAVWMMSVEAPKTNRIVVSQFHQTEPVQLEPEPVKPLSKGYTRRIKTVQTLSAQERALVQWVGESPETAVAEWTAFKERVNTPIEMKDLEIQPIATEEQER